MENCFCSIPISEWACSAAADLCAVQLDQHGSEWMCPCCHRAECMESHLQWPEDRRNHCWQWVSFIEYSYDKLWSWSLPGEVGKEWGRSWYTVLCLIFIAQFQWQNSYSRRKHTRTEYSVLLHIRQYVTALKMLQQVEWPGESRACWEAETELSGWAELCGWCCELHVRYCGERCSHKPFTAKAPAALTSILTAYGAVCPGPWHCTQMCIALIIPDVCCTCFKGRGRGCWINQFCLPSRLANSNMAFVCDRCDLEELNVQCGWLWLLDRTFLLPKIEVLMSFSSCSDKITIEYIIILRRDCFSISSGWSMSCCPSFLKTQLRAILVQGILDV